MRTKHTIAVTAVACSVVTVALAQTRQPVAQQPPAQQQPLAAILPNPLFDRIPGAQECPTADWIKPGTRLVFFSTNATTQTNPGQMGMKRDPNGGITDNNGNKWSLTGFTGDSGGGVGYTVIDVVASDPNALVLDHRLYFLPQGKGGPAVFTSAEGSIIHPSGNDFFLHPRLLNQVPDADTQTVNIIRQQYDLNNQRFNAMRVTLCRPGVSLSSNVYDLTSGVLLFSRAAGASSQGQVVDRNGQIVNSASVASGTHTFMGTREVQLPWKTSQMPAWVKQVRKLHYSGNMISRATGNEGLGDLATPLSAEIAIQHVGSNWSSHEITSLLSTNTAVQNVPSRSMLVTGPASVDGVWKDPNFLRQLQTGQAIDQDQTIGTQTMVEFAGTGNDGRAVVAITTVTSAQRTTNVYDANDGKLIQATRSQPNPGTNLTTITQLNLTGVE